MTEPTLNQRIAVLGLICSLAGACSVGFSGRHVDRLPPARSLLTVVLGAESIAQIRVVSLEGPFWNSSDGDTWGGYIGNKDSDPPPPGVPPSAPIQYTRVIAITEQVFAGGDLPASLELTVFGDATKRWESTEPPPEGWSSSGGFVEGESFIVSLTRLEFPYEDRVERAWSTSYAWEATWRIDGDLAVGSRTKWSMPVGALKDALLAAWAARPQLEEQTT